MKRFLANLKRKLKPLYFRNYKRFVDRFRSYGPDELAAGLRSLGIEKGDAVMMHSSFSPYNGFRGSPGAVIDALRRVLGEEGTLLMVSLPYRSSTIEYLKDYKGFDVRKTPSAMGLISEIFRKRDGALRSLHPTHPVLAQGPKAEWVLGGHENCLYACGPGSPFEKLAQLDGKVLFFNAPFATFTFFHYLEHRVSEKIRFPLYAEEPFEVPILDRRGERIAVKAKVFSPEAIRRRRLPFFEAEMERRGLIRKKRVGNSRLLLVRLSEVLQGVDEMTRQKVFFYDLSGLSVNTG